MVVSSDLATTYDTGARLINRALEDVRQELGCQERNITPVDLASNEIYDVLRKRLFKSLPDTAERADIAASYRKKLEEASKSKSVNRGAEAIADEIAATYPFHPRLKNVVALFEENEQFRQTRGLIELASGLLRSVWERKSNDVFLIGPQHFDLSIQEVRDKLTEIFGMRDAIAMDLWNGDASARAQVVDLKTGQDAATQVGLLLLTSSLSTAMNPFKGLTREEIVECLVSPLRDASDFLSVLDELQQMALYIYGTAGRYYFVRRENLNVLLSSPAHDAPENQVDNHIRHRLSGMPTTIGGGAAELKDTRHSRTVRTQAETLKRRKTTSDWLNECKVHCRTRSHEKQADLMDIDRSVYFDLKMGRRVREEQYIKAAKYINAHYAACTPDDLKPDSY